MRLLFTIGIVIAIITGCLSDRESKDVELQTTYGIHQPDLQVQPTEDFYMFANGLWIQKIQQNPGEFPANPISELKIHIDSLIYNDLLKVSDLYR
ncbi:MAG: hypothetical protein OEY34_02260, partial [Cyclobacteriaceae bacterium]|nr:hypothetical protein [Cyclobacteriaceae bacterium]